MCGSIVITVRMPKALRKGILLTSDKEQANVARKLGVSVIPM
ncbi:MAG: hypothetical protein ACP5L5_08510 [Vulcanisaeta sp.]